MLFLFHPITPEQKYDEIVILKLHPVVFYALFA